MNIIKKLGFFIEESVALILFVKMIYMVIKTKSNKKEYCNCIKYLKMDFLIYFLLIISGLSKYDDIYPYNLKSNGFQMILLMMIIEIFILLYKKNIEKQ